VPERKFELARISHHHGDLWLINYKLWALCGCYYDRYIIQHRSETEPTTEEALKIIYEDKNKR
jgi:hypothetical protein